MKRLKDVFNKYVSRILIFMLVQKQGMRSYSPAVDLHWFFQRTQEV